jgi:lambda repressor-like predicted transcriptional regulator
MAITAMHPEDVKAELRKRFGTIENFAHTRDIKPMLVFDLLRGQSSTVSKIVAEAIGVDPDHFQVSRDSKLLERNIKPRRRAHSLNRGAK